MIYWPFFAGMTLAIVSGMVGDHHNMPPGSDSSSPNQLGSGGSRSGDKMTGMTFRDSQQAFLDAVKAGALSLHPNADNSVRHYMYMYSGERSTGKYDAFKHIDTRSYLFVETR